VSPRRPPPPHSLNPHLHPDLDPPSTHAALFDHEKLQACQPSLQFVSLVTGLLGLLPKGLAVSDQLDRAWTSIPLNLAEGNGKVTPLDRLHEDVGEYRVSGAREQDSDEGED
jgi:hypothetical protein